MASTDERELPTSLTLSRRRARAGEAVPTVLAGRSLLEVADRVDGELGYEKDLSGVLMKEEVAEREGGERG